MAIQEKRWFVSEKKQDIVDRLLTELPSLTPITAQILANRGVKTGQAAQDFLSTSLESLHSPFLLQDMDKAVAKVEKALALKEKILIYGDYDVDGITSTAVLLNTLDALGGLVEYYLPHRLEEGYGLNKVALDKAHQRGIKLVITVDCGISGQDEIEYAKNIGLEVIITDHHHPGEILPPALAVINPKKEGCLYPFKDLAGVGVAYKLAEALISQSSLVQKEELLSSLRELVAIGTIADIVPLIYENRVLVKRGLEALHNTKRLGIQALQGIGGMESKDFNPYVIGFLIGPRLNALGRLCSKDLPANLLHKLEKARTFSAVEAHNTVCLGVELLTTSSWEEAKEIADFLETENKKRQGLEGEIFQAAVQLLEEQWDPEREKVIVLGHEDWHLGVIGIVASRLVERYYRPVILLNFKDQLAKGSARSIKGFHIFHAFQECHDLLEKYGGHELAAGLTLTQENLPAFRKRINLLAEECLDEDSLLPALQVDVDGVNLDQLSFDLLQQLETLAPYGCENPQPLLACRNAKLLEFRSVGSNNNHLKLKAATGRASFDGIAFGLGGYAPELSPSKTYDLLFCLEKNEWRGRVSLQLKVQDLQLSKADFPSISQQVEHKPQEEVYYTEVVGANGIENQKIISQLHRGNLVQICLDKEHPGVKTIRVETLDGQVIGFLNNRLGKKIGGYLKAHLPYSSWVVSVNQLDNFYNLKIAINSSGHNSMRASGQGMILSDGFYHILKQTDSSLPVLFQQGLENNKKIILIYSSALESIYQYQKLSSLSSCLDKKSLVQLNGAMSLVEVGRLLADWTANRINFLFVSKEFYLDYQTLLLQALSSERVIVQELGECPIPEEEQVELEKYWQQLVPSRDFLVGLYRILKAQIPQNAMDRNVFISLHVQEIAKLLQSQGLEATTFLQISAGLDILEEMNLLEREREGDKQYIYRLPIPKIKFNLGNLLRYREDLRVKQRLAKKNL